MIDTDRFRHDATMTDVRSWNMASGEILIGTSAPDSDAARSNAYDWLDEHGLRAIRGTMVEVTPISIDDRIAGNYWFNIAMRVASRKVG